MSIANKKGRGLSADAPIQKVLKALYRATGHEASPSGSGFITLCPGHDDSNPSLSISEGDGGNVLVKCHAGCQVEAVVNAVGLSMADLYPPSSSSLSTQKLRSKKRPQNSPKTTTTLTAKRNCENNESAPDSASKAIGPREVATYDYRDEKGELLFQVVRYEPKSFRQRRPKEGGGWVWSVKDLRQIPYRLPELLVADPKQTIVIVEGEKDVDTLRSIGVVATCNAGGAKKWTAAHAQFLLQRNVATIADNDKSGREHQSVVAESLSGIAKSIRVLELPNLSEKGDVTDWVNAGGTKEALNSIYTKAKEWHSIKNSVSGESSSENAVWPEFEPFERNDLPSFPAETLPKRLSEWVRAESRATQTPLDLSALLSISVISARLARKVVVQPRHGWVEPVNLYVSVLLDPGNRKSAVFSDAVRPLREIEAELIDKAGPEIALRQSERRQDEARLRKLEKLAAEKNDREAGYEAAKLSAELSERPEPALPRLLVDDATSEKLGMMLAEQGGRIASMSPEGGVFDLMAGLYSKSGMPQFGVYLMGHSGDDLVVDRVGRKSLRVKQPALNCAYAMQPAVIEGLAEHTAFRGRGLLARFLYAAPRSWIGEREIAPIPVSEAIRDRYHQIVRSLELPNCDEPIVLLLNDEADKALREWENEIEDMLAEGGEMEEMRDWGAKLAGATVRIAAILHCVEYGVTGKINHHSLKAAVEIASFLIPHAEAVLQMMSAKEGSDDDALYVLRWIERHQLTKFTKRDAQQHGKRRFPSATDIDPAINDLKERGYIRQVDQDIAGPGRPPSPLFEVNPIVTAKFDSQSETSKHAATNEIGEQADAENRIRVVV
jgi:5S rRNA maturation endonuclease (ribonuclease M5)